MIGAIKEKFTTITTKCAGRYAKENGTMKENIQIVFKIDDKGNTEYLLYKSYAPLKKISFMELLGVKMDLMGYSLYVPKFIKGCLERFCEEESIEKKNVRVVLCTQENDDLIMYLYDGGKFIREVELESLFNPEDLVKEE